MADEVGQISTWNHYSYIDKIPEDTLGISLCTMDFGIKLRNVPGTLPEDRAFHELIRNPKLIKDDFVIKTEEILPFISSLEEATGGRGTFRHLVTKSSVLRNDRWNFKIIRFYLSPLNNGFIVCDRYSRAVRWREIIPSIVKEELSFQDSTQTENDERGTQERDT